MNSILRAMRSAILSVALVLGLGGSVVAQAVACHCCCAPERTKSTISCECCCHTPACDCEIKSGEPSKPQSPTIAGQSWTPSAIIPLWDWHAIPVPRSLGTIPSPPEGELIRFGHSALHERAPPRFS